MLREPLGLLRLVGYLEGATLVLLVFVAVPLKYVGGQPLGVSVLGPVHGLSFVMYMVMCVNVLSDGKWSSQEITRVFGAAMIPFGTFLNDRYLASKQQELRDVEQS